jgi:hypothetical protein
VFLVGKAVRKTSLSRTKRRLEAKIEVDRKEKEYQGVNWTGLAYCRERRTLVNTEIIFCVPYEIGNLLNS